MWLMLMSNFKVIGKWFQSDPERLHSTALIHGPIHYYVPELQVDGCRLLGFI